MAYSIKNSPEPDSSGKPVSPSQTPQSGSEQAPRSNPVCLEVGVTLRSLPSEAGGLAQPLREEVRTVIVFDDGAVLRCPKALPPGLTLVLSNSARREVVCKVSAGRSLPSMKGYVEIEFLEQAKDFWSIQQDSGASAFVAPAADPPAISETPAPPTPKPAPVQAAPPRIAPAPEPPRKPMPSVEPPAKPVSPSWASTPSFDEFPGPMGVPTYTAKQEPKPEPLSPAKPNAKTGGEGNHSNVAASTPAVNWTPPAPEAFVEKPAFPVYGESASAASASSVPAPDFMNTGLTAGDQSSDSSKAPVSRMPWILGAAAVVLAAIGGTYSFMHQSPAPANASASAVTHPARTEPAAANRAPEPAPVQPAKEVTSSAAEPTVPQPQVRPVSAEAAPAAAAAPISTTASSISAMNASRSESKSTRQPEKDEKVDVAAKQPAPSTPARPAIKSLKMTSPSRPAKTLADSGDAAAPLADISSPATPMGSTPASLLASGRTPGAPAPPVQTPGPGAVTDPKLISSTRPGYPPTARQGNIQGTVTVSAVIDETGKVISARAINGPVMLRAAAEDSVKQWKYSPATVDGKPSISRVMVNIDFKLH